MSQNRLSSSQAASSEALFDNVERERLASLPRDLRKTRLQELMNLLNERELGAITDDDAIASTPSPPPVPPRESPPQPQKKARRGERLSYYSPTLKRINSNRVTYVSSDSDSSDFEHFVPPIYPRKRYSSEPHCVISQNLQSCFRQTSFSEHKSSSTLQNSSPVLTRKPSWLEKKQRRSQSVDVTGQLAAAAEKDGDDSDDSSSATLGSTGYSKPFEHVLAWRKVLGATNVSLLTGSLPQIDKAVDGPEGSYLDHSEIAKALTEAGNELDRKVSQRLRKQRSKMQSTDSNHYLSLINIVPDNPTNPPITSYAHTQMAVSSAEKLKGKSFGFPLRPDSGQSVDASPVDRTEMKENSGYSEVPVRGCAEDPTDLTNGIYEELKDHQSPDSVSSPGGDRDSTPAITDPSMNSEDGYCKLEDAISSLPLSFGLQVSTIDSPPIPPPRKPVPPPRKKRPSQDVLEGQLKPPRLPEQTLGVSVPETQL